MLTGYSDWHTRALCRTRDPALYFTSSGSRTAQKRAETLCYGCDVVRACAAQALACHDHGVIRGGVAIFDRGRTYRRMLERVAAGGHPGSRDADRCTRCDQRLRPWRSVAADHPGTVRRGSTTHCHSCHAKGAAPWTTAA